MNIDFGRLSKAQTMEIAEQALQELGDEDLYAVIDRCLSDEDREELMARWEPPPAAR